MSAVTVRAITGYNTKGDLGIELEVEGTRTLPVIMDDIWITKEDESLRGTAYEYVTNRPITFDSTKLSKIKQLTDRLAVTEGVVLDSPRTSLHVHVNVLDHTPLQVWTAACTYWLLENVLIKYCGEDQREGNLFCLRLIDSEAVLKYAIADTSSRYPFDSLRTDNIRYAGQNLNAIWKFGTLEYRGMRGTIDPNVIDTWTTEMYNIVHKSKRFKSPEEVLDTYLANPEGFMDLVISPSFIYYMKSYTGWKKLLKENAAILCQFCYCQNWDKWEKNINNLFGKKETVEDMYGTAWDNMTDTGPIATTRIRADINWGAAGATLQPRTTR